MLEDFVMKPNEDLSYECANCSHPGSENCPLNIESKTAFSDSKKNTLIKKGDVIFKENGNPTGVYVIYDGKVKISKLGEEGKEQIMRFAKSGDFIGYRSVIGEETYHATATALNDVRLCQIPKENFYGVLRCNAELMQNLLKILAEDLKNAEERILSISQKSVKERIAETLILLHHKFGTKANESIDVKLSRKDISNIAGATIETTIRTLSEFKKQGFIEFDGKQIIVKSIPKLINLANIH